MNLKNKDLELLIKIENYLGFKTKQTDLRIDLENLIERLLNNKQEYNKNNYARIKEKRKINKNYARKKRV